MAAASQIKLTWIFTLLSLAFVSPSPGFAGVLTILGRSNLQATIEGENIRIVGAYEMRNNGDETALDVFPEFELGNWKQAEEPMPLEPGQTYRWNIDLSLPREELLCAKGDRCAALDLPVEGRFPLLVLHHYSDQNNYPFSAAEVVALDIGQTPARDPLASSPAQVEAHLLLGGKGEDFGGLLKVKNLSSEDLRLAVSFHTSAELEIVVPPQVLELSSNTLGNSKVELRNLRGILGSRYAVHAVLQWEELGLRNSLSVPGSISLKQLQRDDVEQTQTLIFAVLVLVIVLPSLLLLGLVLRLRR